MTFQTVRSFVPPAHRKFAMVDVFSEEGDHPGEYLTGKMVLFFDNLLNFRAGCSRLQRLDFLCDLRERCAVLWAA
jgi:hypothetical protein